MWFYGDDTQHMEILGVNSLLTDLIYIVII